MISKCSLLGSTLSLASVAMGGARITLVADPPPPYGGGELVFVDLLLSQEDEDDPAPRLLRFLQVDTSDTDEALEVDSSGPVWDFSGLPGCAGNPVGDCDGYYFDDDMGPGSFGPNTASMAYYFQSEDNLGPNPAAQIAIPAEGSVRVGTLEVRLPAEPGSYVLDLVNADEPDVNKGSVVTWGFGLTHDDPVRNFRPLHAAPNELLGGQLTFEVQAHLVASIPRSCKTTNGSGSSLWCVRSNSVLLDFDRPIAAPMDSELEIRELLADGEFGPNLNVEDRFAFRIEDGGTRLRVREIGSVLQHQKWYVIRNVGDWVGVGNFEIKLVVQMGDANADGRVSGGDVSTINDRIPCARCPDDRRDMNGDGRIVAADVSIANARIPSANVNIPSGHTCP